MLLKREIVLSKQSDLHLGGHGDNGSIFRYEWLVKWTGLGYDNVTWELDDAPFLTSPEGMKLKNDYDCHHNRADRLLKNHFAASKVLLLVSLYIKNLLLLRHFRFTSFNFLVFNLKFTQTILGCYIAIYDATNELTHFYTPLKKNKTDIGVGKHNIFYLLI